MVVHRFSHSPEARNRRWKWANIIIIRVPRWWNEAWTSINCGQSRIIRATAMGRIQCVSLNKNIINYQSVRIIRAWTMIRAEYVYRVCVEWSMNIVNHVRVHRAWLPSSHAPMCFPHASIPITWNNVNNNIRRYDVAHIPEALMSHTFHTCSLKYVTVLTGTGSACSYVEHRRPMPDYSPVYWHRL
jgi:hypothetical protein